MLFSLSKIKANWKSGLTVALVSIPLSISLAVASGVSPVAGIITAIWASFIGASFGSSNYNIIGPTGALSGIIASYALLHGPQNVPMLAILSGIFILLAYFLRIERYLIFIPSSVIHGFTLGVACIIALNQLNFVLGLQNLPKHETLIENLLESFKHIKESSWPALAIFILFFLILLLLRRAISSIPGIIIISPLCIALGYVETKGLLPFSLETLGSKFGMIEPHLIQFSKFTFNTSFIVPAGVVAFVAIIESILSAKIADVMTKTKHVTSKEIFGLGIANIIAGLAGGMPATAALARTSLNIKTGATSKASAILSSIFIAFASLFLSYFSFMPMACIASVLVYVALSMIEREHFYRLFYQDKNSFIIAIVVALITIGIDPIIGILVGVVMALLFLVNKLAQSFSETVVYEGNIKTDSIDAQKKSILIYTFRGKLVYFNSPAHLLQFQSDFSQYDAIILVLTELYFIDLDGVDTLEEIIELIQKRHQQVVMVVSQKFTAK